MSHARAAIAGVLAVGIVLLLVFPSEGAERQAERALAAFIGLLVVLALLIDVDILTTWRAFRDRDKPPPSDPPS